MYKTIKRLLRAFIPTKVLMKNENLFRGVLFVFYKGRNFHCNVCNKSFRKFIIHDDGDKICPSCGSLSRDRRLWSLINDMLLKDNNVILDFSPSRSIYRELKKKKDIHYVSSTYGGDFLSDFQYDITGIDVEDEKFDGIICYHILEHIVNDMDAMSELYRVLKRGGTCLIQTPFKDGEIYEDFSIQTPEDRLLHFGQEDHVRVYSVESLKERLEISGFNVEVKHFIENANNKMGYKTNENILVCTK